MGIEGLWGRYEDISSPWWDNYVELVLSDAEAEELDYAEALDGLDPMMGGTRG